VLVHNCAAPGGRISPADQGAAGVEQTVADIEGAGGRIIGREVGIKAACWRTRANLNAELPSGQPAFIEVKTGPGAELSLNQEAAYPEIIFKRLCTIRSKRGQRWSHSGCANRADANIRWVMPEPTYREGDWFAVPLRAGGFAAVIVARAMPRKEGVLLGYFFGPGRDRIPALDEIGVLSASDAVLVGRFGDLSILDGTWPLVGHIDRWDRSAWPIPVFGRLEELTGRAFKVIYDDGDPNRLLREERIDASELASLPQDGLSGAGAVERILTRLLS
jgi:hypothetical protein